MAYNRGRPPGHQVRHAGSFQLFPATKTYTCAAGAGVSTKTAWVRTMGKDRLEHDHGQSAGDGLVYQRLKRAAVRLGEVVAVDKRPSVEHAEVEGAVHWVEEASERHGERHLRGGTA